MDDEGRCTDRVSHRQPLFSRDVGKPPHLLLGVDLLHGLYYGAVMRWTSATLWRILISNPWRMPGSFENRCRNGITHLRAHLLRYNSLHKAKPSARGNDLILSMLGSDSRKNADEPHPGSAMPTKAAETRDLMTWALQALRDLGSDVPHRDRLLAAGDAMERYLELIWTSPRIVPAATVNELWCCCQRHILLSQRAGITMTPKHHLFVHLTRGSDQQQHQRQQRQQQQQ